MLREGVTLVDDSVDAGSPGARVRVGCTTLTGVAGNVSVPAFLPQPASNNPNKVAMEMARHILCPLRAGVRFLRQTLYPLEALWGREYRTLHLQWTRQTSTLAYRVCRSLSITDRWHPYEEVDSTKWNPSLAARNKRPFV